MKLAWFGLAEIERGGVGDEVKLLEALARVSDLHLHCERAPARAIDGATVVSLSPGRPSDLGSYDMAFYNLANSCPQYATIFDAAQANPGIALLHDTTFLRFFLDYDVRYHGKPARFAARLIDHYGIVGMAVAVRLLGDHLDRPAPKLREGDERRYPLIEAALGDALGAVAYSASDRALVSERWPGPVHELSPGDPDLRAAELVEFADRVATHVPGARIATPLAETLARLGVSVSTPGFDRVAAEAAALLERPGR